MVCVKFRGDTDGTTIRGPLFGPNFPPNPHLIDHDPLSITMQSPRSPVLTLCGEEWARTLRAATFGEVNWRHILGAALAFDWALDLESESASRSKKDSDLVRRLNFGGDASLNRRSLIRCRSKKSVFELDADSCAVEEVADIL